MSIHPPLQRRLLVADDDREVRSGVADLLEGPGLEILLVESGTAAIEIVRRMAIHAALLDMHMPGCTGIEAIALMRREHADLPCIVYSGRWSPLLEQEVLSAGAFACLKKPVEPLTLRLTVSRALGFSLDELWQRNN